jgi:hypothetical protein
MLMGCASATTRTSAIAPRTIETAVDPLRIAHCTADRLTADPAVTGWPTWRTYHARMVGTDRARLVGTVSTTLFGTLPIGAPFDNTQVDFSPGDRAGTVTVQPAGAAWELEPSLTHAIDACAVTAAQSRSGR